MDWYRKVSRGGLSAIPSCMDYYEEQLIDARKELNIEGKRFENVSAKLAGTFEMRYAQLQEVEAILEYLNVELNKTKSTLFRKYLENYNKSLTAREADKYIEGDSEYVNMTLIVNEFALIRNRYLAVTKGLDQVSWQLGHIARLRSVGLDDVMIN